MAAPGTGTPHRRPVTAGAKALKTFLVASTVVGALTAGQAQALIVNVGGKVYDVTVFESTYAASIAKFALPPAGVMPWWGNQQLALDFANAIGNGFGRLQSANSADAGPLFAHSAPSTISAAYYNLTTNQAVNFPTFGTAPTRFWAQAVEKVPAPLPLLGALAAFGTSRHLRKRIKAG